MVRLYGRAPRGKRCLAKAPYGHWQSATFIAALRHDRISAPCLIDGPINGDLFRAYVEQSLCPELAPGDLVICDNLASHKVKGVAEAIHAVGAQILYLPAYSPDLNPIEMAFAKLKAFLRRSAARNWPALLSATANALNSFSALHCKNFFRHALYATD